MPLYLVCVMVDSERLPLSKSRVESLSTQIGEVHTAVGIGVHFIPAPEIGWRCDGHGTSVLEEDPSTNGRKGITICRDHMGVDV